METAAEVGIWVTTSLAVAGALAFVGRVAIDRWFSLAAERHRLDATAELDRFRIQTQAIRDQQVESLKAELRVVAAQRDSRFTMLHERRVDAIAELSAAITKANDVVRGAAGPVWLQSAPTPAPADDFARRSSLMSQAFADLLDAVARTRIWLPPSVAPQVESLWRLVMEATDLFVQAGGALSDPTVWAFLDDELYPAVEAMEQRFRGLLDEEAGTSEGSGLGHRAELVLTDEAEIGGEADADRVADDANSDRDGTVEMKSWHAA
jgi:hypothetical protein